MYISFVYSSRAFIVLIYLSGLLSLVIEKLKKKAQFLPLCILHCSRGETYTIKTHKFNDFSSSGICYEENSAEENKGVRVTGWQVEEKCFK